MNLGLKSDENSVIDTSGRQQDSISKVKKHRGHEVGEWETVTDFNYPLSSSS